MQKGVLLPFPWHKDGSYKYKIECLGKWIVARLLEALPTSQIRAEKDGVLSASIRVLAAWPQLRYLTSDLPPRLTGLRSWDGTLPSPSKINLRMVSRGKVSLQTPHLLLCDVLYEALILLTLTPPALRPPIGSFCFYSGH